MGKDLKCTRCGKDHLHDNPEINVLKHRPWSTAAGVGKVLTGICTLCKSTLIQMDTERKKIHFRKELRKEEARLDKQTERAIRAVFCLQCGDVNDRTDSTFTPIGLACSRCKDINSYTKEAAKDRRGFYAEEDKRHQRNTIKFTRDGGWERK